MKLLYVFAAVLILAVPAFLVTPQRRKDPGPYWTPPGLDPARAVISQAMRGEYGTGRVVVHQTPEHDAVPQVTPCCSVPVAELPWDEHFSYNPLEVTCGGPGAH